MADSRFVEVADKGISEIKINSFPKTQKTCVKIYILSGNIFKNKITCRVR
jgi:hypothetical protein